MFQVIDLCAVCFMFRVGLLILWCSIVFGGLFGTLGFRFGFIMMEWTCGLLRFGRLWGW